MLHGERDNFMKVPLYRVCREFYMGLYFTYTVGLLTTRKFPTVELLMITVSKKGITNLASECSLCFLIP